MYWKIEKAMLDKFTRVSRSYYHSITIRMALLYALSAFLLLALSCIYLYWNFSNHLRIQNENFLINKILIIKSFQLKNHMKPTIHKSLRDDILLDAPVDHYFARLVDGYNNIVIETPDMQNIVSLKKFNNSFQGDDLTFQTIAVHPKNQSKKHYLFTMYRTHATHHSQIHSIQIAKDISEEHEMLEDYQRNLAAILLLGIILSTIIGIVIAQRNLKSLRDITKTTERITITQLKERLNPASLPSELSALAVAYNGMLSRIEEGFIRLSQFTDDIAHEFRTPITNLMIAAEIILSKPRDNEEYRLTLESTLEEFQRLSHLIDNLLFLAQSDNPRETINRAPIDINQLFKNICDFYHAAADENNITIHYVGSGYVEAEPILLRRAITNLVSNALKYTDSNGSITLSTHHTEGKEVHISVSDSGNGISAEHLPHLFERFYRVDSSRTHNTGGTGLGLAIVKSIMELHQGSVNLISHPEKGTTVTLIFPSTHKHGV